MNLLDENDPWATRMLALLLAEDFPGVVELRAQALRARLQTLVLEGAPAFIVHLPEDVKLATVRNRIPVEAQAGDEDGMDLHCLLHVVDGKLVELELYRADTEDIRVLPAPELWAIDSGSGRVGSS